MPEHVIQIEHLLKSVLFSGISPEEAETIIPAARWREIEQGEYVYRQGDNDRCFYLIVSGEVELTMNLETGRQLSVGHIGPGGHFGETSLLTNSSNSLNVLALTPLSLLCFTAEAFASRLLANPVVEHRLSISLAERLRISFRDHANSQSKTRKHGSSIEHNLDPTFFSGSNFSGLKPSPSAPQSTRVIESAARLGDSTIYRQVARAIDRFSTTLEPILITGETGTGRRMVAYEIHAAGHYRHGPYTEVDIRNIDPTQMETELFGYDRDHLAFSQAAQPGIFEQMQGGTAVLYNAEYMEPDIQRQLTGILKKGAFTKVGGATSVPLRSRIILNCRDEPQQLDGHNRLLPSLYTLVANQHFQAAPLREHRRDIPRLIHYYLKRYNLQYGKNITEVDDQTLGKFMNYDWPGNLTELASVMQRAVILGKSNEPLTDQLLLGVPRPEGKWEFNLLRFKWVRACISTPLFPVLPRTVVGVFFICVLAVLFFGPSAPEKNIGLTLSWVVGWPLLIFAFFFLARTWCSVCGLSVPGWLAQIILRPERPTPRIIRHYSGWIMAALCILLFWIETAWDAYASPSLTGWIILSITMGSLIFSMFYKRRVWCRYLCPLGAINALFSMPSILELRSNSQMCMNRCDNHSCYTGDDHAAGCPMFRHPFLVDNNRDCILCGQCVKNCRLNSIHLNLRLAPQELWNQQAPRLADSFLVISLAAIFYPFAVNQNFPAFFDHTAGTLQTIGFKHSTALAASLVFFSCIAVYLGGYTVMSGIMARVTGNNWKTTASILGYGMIPLVLGAFMAAHLAIIVNGLWLLPANLLDLAGIGGEHLPRRVISRDATIVLQLITVLGGLIASLYATHRIIKRLVVGRPYSSKMFTLPAVLLSLSALAHLQLV